MSMDLERSVALGFLCEHPAAAARLLERSEEQEVARVLEQLEPQDLARVLSAFSPSVSSRQLAILSTSRAVGAVSALGPERGAVLMRRVPGERREELMTALSEADRRSFEKLLRYPEGSAGALMDPHAATFHREQTVGEVLEVIRSRWRDLRYYVFVLDDEHRLAGVLSLRELVASPIDAALGSVMHSPVESISARASRRGILAHEGWKRFPQLPVVDESDRLLGVLRYRTLRRLQDAGDDDEAADPLGLALALGELFWLGAAGVFRGLSAESALATDTEVSRSGSG